MSNKPVPTGEYAVGAKTFTLYNTRKEALDPKGTAMRNVFGLLYYPVLKESTEGLKRAKSLTRSEAAGLRKAFNIPLNYDKLDRNGENDSESFVDAPFIEGKKFPLIVFSHGYFSYPRGNSFLLIELASHGYAVLSIGHPREASGIDYDDGTFELCDKSLSRKMYDPFLPAIFAALKLTKMKGTNEELAEKFNVFQNKYCKFHHLRIAEWVKDTELAVEHVRKEFSDIIDFSNGIGISGHSLGGDTAYALCQTSSDYSCGINIDGGLFGNYEGMVMEKPFMQISCEDNENVVTRGYIRHKAPAYKVLFRGMKHVGFSDMKFAMKMPSFVGKLDSNLAHRYTCRCHLEFFDAFLKKLKPAPEIESNGDITLTEFAPDM